MQQRGWAVVTTKGGTGAERQVVGRLEQQGFHSYYPRIRTCESRGGRARTRVEPLFPRYVFVQIKDKWIALTGTRGVSNLIMCGEKPSIAPHAAIAAMQAREGDDGIIVLNPKFGVDEPVRSMRGSFEGLIGKCAGVASIGRVRVLYEILGTIASVVVPEGDLEAA